MAQTGYNQFSNFGHIAGQSDPMTTLPSGSPRAPSATVSDPTAQKQGLAPLPQTPGAPPTGNAGGSTIDPNSARFQGLYAPPTPASTGNAGAAGQVPPTSAPATPAAPQAPPAAPPPQQPPALPPMAPPPAPSWHGELGNLNDPGAWTNGYNPHMVQDQAPPDYPPGTFPGAAPPTGAGAAPSAAPPSSAAPAPAPDPFDGTGWLNNESPQGFMRDNPGYATTGYYGTPEQVAAQVAGHAQSAGIPTGVLDSSYYTQDPSTGPVWTPPPDPAVVEAQRRAAAQYQDDVGRFAPPPVAPPQYPPGTFPAGPPPTRYNA